MPVLARPSELSAALYDRAMASLEDGELGHRRRSLLAEANGTVLDVGAGTGANIPYYRGVDRVVALEPHRGRRRRMERVRVPLAAVPVDVVAAGVDDAEFPDGAFDTVVCTLVLCTVPDPGAALDRIGRWLAPTGRLLFLEHMAAVAPGATVAQRALAPAWRLAAGGCHLRRDLTASIRDSGLVITDLRRFSVRPAWPVMAACIEGRARPRTAFAEAA